MDKDIDPDLKKAMIMLKRSLMMMVRYIEQNFEKEPDRANNLNLTEEERSRNVKST